MELPQRPLRPKDSRWRQREMFGFEDPLAVAYQLYVGQKGIGVFVTSCFYPDAGRWRLTISAMWRRPTDDEVALMLSDFGAKAFEEERSGERRSLIRHFAWPAAADSALA